MLKNTALLVTDQGIIFYENEWTPQGTDCCSGALPGSQFNVPFDQLQVIHYLYIYKSRERERERRNISSFMRMNGPLKEQIVVLVHYQVHNSTFLLINFR